MSHVLVCQLARMGDLCQSLPLLRDLKEAEGCTVSVLVDRRLGELAAHLAPWLDGVFTIDIQAHLETFRNSLSWVASWERLETELRSLRQARFDRVVNLNFGPLAAAVVKTFGDTSPVEGFGSLDAESPAAEWNNFIRLLLQTDRRLCRFHLVDIFRFHSARKAASRWSDGVVPSPLTSRSTLGVQVGTRCAKRTWAETRFAEVLRTVQSELGVRVVLFGDQREALSARRVARGLKAELVTDLVGKTSLPDLAEALSGCDRILSADTGTLHMAAWLGVPSVALFFGPARVFETGPYGSGHFVLQSEPECAPCSESSPCGRPVCSEAIPPAGVARLLAGSQWTPPPPVVLYEPTQVGHWLQYRPIPRRKATVWDVLGLLCWGAASEILPSAQGRVPSLSDALDFLCAHYDLTPWADSVEDNWTDGFRLPDLPPERQSALAAILRRGWRELLERIRNHDHAGEESLRAAGASA
jgi:ADP-heptose:LPS heptosyltransferase